MVDRAGGGRGDYWATAPALIAEVLSPSTAKIDLGDKAAEYLRLPSLCAYLAFEQDEPKAWVWLRGDEGIVPAPSTVAGRDETIRIAALNITLPLAEIYRELQCG